LTRLLTTGLAGCLIAFRGAGLATMITMSTMITAGSAQQPVADAPPAAGAAFPLSVAPGGRFLQDKAGKPFLLHGDTAWSLMAELTREEVELYLQDRRARGFNTLLVSLIEARFATKAPANIYGEAPFLKVGDFATPNEAYFAHAEWVLQRIEDLGFAVLLTPAYIGARGTDQGWYTDMARNGSERLRDYGRYVGRRFGRFKNIIWVNGGDDNPPDPALVRAVAEGIRETMPDALHTAHCAAETSAAEIWGAEPWLQVNNAYTYGAVYNAVAREYWRLRPMPVFLIESTYEAEHGVSEQQLRAQAYSALLAGAFGQVFGNNPIWHFSGPTLFPAATDWRTALSSRGTQSMSHLQKLFGGLPWWTLEPDFDRRLVVDGIGKGLDRLAAAQDRDGKLAVVYLPTIRTIGVDMGRLSSAGMTARWYDPSAGTYAAIEGPPLPPGAVRHFKPGGPNAAGFEDWVLVLTGN
jgi:hypothetical protein